MSVPCCDYRDHSPGPCACDNHASSDMHPNGSGHGFNPGGTDLETQLIHGADCDECHDFLRQMSADRCCEWHYARKYGVPGWEQYRARRAELLGNRPEVRGS